MALKTWRAALALGLALSSVAFTGGCNNEDKIKADELSAQLAQAQNDREALKAQADAAQARAAELERQNQSLAAQALNNQPSNIPSGSGNPGGFTRSAPVVLEVAGDVAFNAGQATLTSAGKKELDKISATLKSKYSGNSIRVEGYTDSDPIRKSKWASNEALSLARAQAVAQYLTSKGISSNRVDSVGMGSANPKSSKAASRRVEIHVLG